MMQRHIEFEVETKPQIDGAISEFERAALFLITAADYAYATGTPVMEVEAGELDYVLQGIAKTLADYKPIQDYAATWNSLREQVFELDAFYNELPFIMHEAAELTGIIVEPDAAPPISCLDLEAIEEVDALLCFNRGVNLQDRGLDAVVGEEALDLVQARKYTQIYLADPLITYETQRYLRELRAGVESIRSDARLQYDPRSLSQFLQTCLSVTGVGWREIEDVHGQVIEFEEGVGFYDMMLGDYVEHMRQAAELLQPILNVPEEAALRGMDLNRLRVWIEKVKTLQTPSERRGAEPED